MSASAVVDAALVFTVTDEGVEDRLNAPECRFADMGRRAFATMRRLQARNILAVFAKRAENVAEEFLGFGHSAEHGHHDELKGHDLAFELDFEVLKRLTGLHDLSPSDLDGASPEDWYVRRFTARWMADLAHHAPPLGGAA